MILRLYSSVSTAHHLVQQIHSFASHFMGFIFGRNRDAFRKYAEVEIGPLERQAMSEDERPQLKRTSTLDRVGLALSEKEVREVEESRVLVDELNELSKSRAIMKGKRSITLDDDEQPASPRTLTKRKQRQDMDKLVEQLLVKLPMTRTASLQVRTKLRTNSLQLQVDELVGNLRQVPSVDKKIKKKLDALLPATIGCSLERAIDELLEGQSDASELLEFPLDAWQGQHMQQLLLDEQGELRRRAGTYSRSLLGKWLPLQKADEFLRVDGQPAVLLLKLWLRHLDPWTDEMIAGFADADYVQATLSCLEHIPKMNKRLRRLLAFVQVHAPTSEEPTPLLMTALFLRHFVPLCYASGMPLDTVKRMMHLIIEPNPELMPHIERAFAKINKSS
jgi:hypothetical protein